MGVCVAVQLNASHHNGLKTTRSDIGCEEQMSPWKSYGGVGIVDVEGVYVGFVCRDILGPKDSDSFEEDDEKVNNETCLVAQSSSKHLGYRRKLNLSFKLDATLSAMLCKIRKQAHASHKAKNIVSTTRCFELLHMDLFGPSAVRSYGGNRYTLVIVDDYSRKVKESLNVTFDETPPPSKISPLVDDDLDEEEAIKVTERKNLENNIADETLEIDEIVNIKESRNHPLENVIGNLNQRPRRSTSPKLHSNLILFYINYWNPKKGEEALNGYSWIVANAKKN
ncbi:retrovirus-related pol polyprotein from transposon TNT 1-94 [Tanacetum coccineum]|uniref:Retrovirus-related pol polyprotein from transposon TNT 1-94 n=1 Tax=Tanacetum coccineum TaxID=301880 RepID=A0ABQ5ESE6_9ASTR